MSGEDNLLKLVEADLADEHDYHLQEQVGFILRKANQRHLAIFSARISDLTPPQFAVLAKLHEVGETSQNQLGNLVAMDAATAKGVVDRLKARGLVRLDKHDADRRRLMVDLTEEGRATLERLKAEGALDDAEALGLVPVADTCTYVTSVLRRLDGAVMTNSGKWAHYAPGNIGVSVAFGDLADCVRSAAAGFVVRDTL